MVTNFNMKQHHGWSISELENMQPWEREVNLILMKQHLEEKNERLRLRKQQK